MILPSSEIASNIKEMCLTNYVGLGSGRRNDILIKKIKKKRQETVDRNDLQDNTQYLETLKLPILKLKT